MKTLKDKFEDIVKEVRNVHSYIIPEIIAIPLTEGNRDYPQWVKERLRTEKIGKNIKSTLYQNEQLNM